jgi:hypothetical protein
LKSKFATDGRKDKTSTKCEKTPQFLEYCFITHSNSILLLGNQVFIPAISNLTSGISSSLFLLSKELILKSYMACFLLEILHMCKTPESGPKELTEELGLQ